MPTNYMPSREALFKEWVLNLSSLVTATPLVYGASVQDATTLSGLVTVYTEAYARAADPTTRTHTAILARNTAKAQLVFFVRQVVRKIQATFTVTAEQKGELRITIADKEPTKVPPPDTKPVASVVVADGNDVWLRIADETTPTSRAKIAGATGAEAFAYVGETEPTQLSGWRFLGLFTRTSFHVSFAPEDAGKEATIIVRWVNGKGEPGPFGVPVSTRIIGGVVAAA